MTLFRNIDKHLPHFERGERLTAAKLNELAAAIAQVLWHRYPPQRGAPPAGVSVPMEIIGKLDTALDPATSFETDPASATMSVYTRDSNGHLVDTGRDETVYQRFESATGLAAGAEVKARWIEGEWMADGVGGGAQRIRFTIAEVHCPDPYDSSDELYVSVDWTYYTGGCSATPPGVEYDGTIKVYDSCILDYYTSDSLIGKEGSATYFYPREDSYCSARWIVDSICGQPECDQ